MLAIFTCGAAVCGANTSSSSSRRWAINTRVPFAHLTSRASLVYWTSHIDTVSFTVNSFDARKVNGALVFPSHVSVGYACWTNEWKRAIRWIISWIASPTLVSGSVVFPNSLIVKTVSDLHKEVWAGAAFAFVGYPEEGTNRRTCVNNSRGVVNVT